MRLLMASNTSSKCIRDEDIPVLLTVFNRPEKLRAVVQNLRQIRPKRLFVAADGPRRDHSEDAEKCQRARLEGTNVDWDCHVETRFLNDNIGCDQAIPSAIDWFFQHVEHGIILEDDCIIHPHFFAFCGELLIRYSNDERIMQLSSLSPYPPRAHHYDYHFSRIFRPSGGWATGDALGIISRWTCIDTVTVKHWQFCKPLGRIVPSVAKNTSYYRNSKKDPSDIGAHGTLSGVCLVHPKMG